eukprot:7742833-Lingulodinium_polyedra.AAC.1
MVGDARVPFHGAPVLDPAMVPFDRECFAVVFAAPQGAAVRPQSASWRSRPGRRVWLRAPVVEVGRARARPRWRLPPPLTGT